MSRLCNQLKKDDTPCKASAMPGKDVCPFHDPESRAKATAVKQEKLEEASPEQERVKRTLVDIIQAIESDDYFRPLLEAEGGGLDTWKNWIVCLKAIFALDMDDEEKRIYSEFTGNSEVSTELFKEIYLIIGRRGGKSFVSALIVVYLALFKDWSPYLRAGELGWIFVMASDRDQARVVHGHIKYMLNAKFPEMVEKELAQRLFLVNGIAIEVRTASWRGVRGYTIVAAICDELAFWRSPESANPGEEIIRALRPGMITIPESMLIAISTPYAKKGVLWEIFDKKYGKNDRYTLIWKAATLDMNPTADKGKIERAYEDDPAAAAAEWGAEFRKDVVSPFDPEDIKAVSMIGRRLMLRDLGIRYKAFADPSGGKRDSFTLGIAHEERGIIIVDRLEERQAPCDPKSVTKEFSAIIKEYGCFKVEGDAFAGNWCSNEFLDNGIKYENIDKSKSELYLIFQTLVLSKMVVLLDIPRMSLQLQQLERKTHAGGRDTVDHPKGLHDDVANAVAGACVIVYRDIKHKLSAEYVGQRLPSIQGSSSLSVLKSPHEAQKNRVLQKLRDEGVI